MYLHFKELNKLLILRLFRIRQIIIRVLVQQAHFPLTDVDSRVILDNTDPAYCSSS